MILRDYLYHNRISIIDFSRIIRCDRAYLSRIINGKVKAGRKLAEDIEQATNGQVTIQDVMSVYKDVIF